MLVRNCRFIRKRVPSFLVINDNENVDDLIASRHAVGVMRQKRYVNRPRRLIEDAN